MAHPVHQGFGLGQLNQDILEGHDLERMRGRYDSPIDRLASLIVRPCRLQVKVMRAAALAPKSRSSSAAAAMWSRWRSGGEMAA